MSVVPTGFANVNSPSFLPSAGGVVSGVIAQKNAGIIMGLELTTPIVLGGPFAPGGTATQFALVLEPVGASPHASVALRLNFYDANGTLIGVQDIA